mmetsp:Transcript_29972/g.86942  ORF Transcript_29972/g.86942 Transcript_29972/m.86942 type:complete len:269 (+) Transcript_29972:374-1180(+)
MAATNDSWKRMETQRLCSCWWQLTAPHPRCGCFACGLLFVSARRGARHLPAGLLVCPLPCVHDTEKGENDVRCMRVAAVAFRCHVHAFVSRTRRLCTAFKPCTIAMTITHRHYSTDYRLNTIRESASRPRCETTCLRACYVLAFSGPSLAQCTPPHPGLGHLSMQSRVQSFNACFTDGSSGDSRWPLTQLRQHPLGTRTLCCGDPLAAAAAADEVAPPVAGLRGTRALDGATTTLLPSIRSTRACRSATNAVSNTMGYIGPPCSLAAR